MQLVVKVVVVMRVVVVVVLGMMVVVTYLVLASCAILSYSSFSSASREAHCCATIWSGFLQVGNLDLLFLEF